MSNDSGNQPKAPSTQYREAIALYRASVKWVVSSFGAVAAALVVGVQLTSLGEVHGEKLTWALISAGVALGAVLGIIAAAIYVLSPIGGTYAGFKSGREFKPLRDFLKRDQGPLRGVASSAEELANKYDQAVNAEHEAERAFHTNEGDESLKSKYFDTKKARVDLFPVVRTVTEFGLFLRTKQLFRRQMMAVYLGGALAAAGAVAFAYFANPPAVPEKHPATTKVVTSVRQPLNCASFYFTLDKLAADNPEVAQRWPAGPLGYQARACGFKTRHEVTEFLALLARR